MRVLVATDGSSEAWAAIRWLTRFPVPARAVFRILTVVSLPPSALDIPPVRGYYQTLRDEGQKVVEQARAELAGRWKAIETEVREGEPRDEISAAMEVWAPDLVVVGGRGLGAVSGLLLGSVSTAVVRDATCPVLVVKGRPHALRRVVLAVDGSPDSIAAARLLAALPHDADVTVRLLGVVDRPQLPVTPAEILAATMAPALDALIAERREMMAGVLSRVEQEFKGRVAAVESSVVVGRPAEEIIAAASEPGVDLVIMGARGLGPIRRLILGSVSERVLHHAPCSVLIAKPPRA